MIRADTPASAPELGAGLVIADDPCWELVPRTGHISISATICLLTVSATGSVFLLE